MNVFMIRKCILFLGVVIVCSWHANAQNASCTQNLNSAEDLFEQGNLLGIPRLLNSCFRKSGFSKEETIRAYRLLTLVYIYTDNEALAEQSLVNLFKADPEHPLDENDPAELAYLYEKFKSKPIFRIGIKAGANQTSVNSFGTFGSFNTGDQGTSSTSKTYTPKIGFGVEGTFEYQLPAGLEAILGVGYVIQSYEVSSTPYDPAAFNVTLTESQNWVKVPLMLRYKLHLGNIHPYIYAGGSFDYLLSSKFSGERQGGQTVTISNLDLFGSNLRRQINASVIGGAGIKLRSKTNFIIIEARYSQGIANVVDAGNRYANQELVFRAGHVDDNFAMNNISVSIGYVKSIYRPKKYSEKKLAKRKK